MNRLLVYIITLTIILIHAIALPIYSINTSNNIKIAESKSKDTTKEEKDILLTLEIKKINLRQNVFNIDDENNSVEKNVTIMKESKLPYVRNGNLILGAHSGTGSLAYFNNLIKLEQNDIINIYHDNIKYTYKVDKIYDDDKNSKIIIRRDPTKNTLTLFTCKNNNKSYYLVVIAYLLEKTE